MANEPVAEPIETELRSKVLEDETEKLKQALLESQKREK